MPTLDNIVGGKIKMNGVEYNLVEITYGGTGQVIWPTSQPVTYVIDVTTLVLHYPSNASWIPASGQGYCYATANVKVMSGETVQSTIVGATLTATALSGAYSSNFSISSGNIYGNDLGTNPVNTGTQQSPQGYYCTASFVYTPQEGTPSGAVSATIFQQYNRIESTVVSVASVPYPATVANTGGTVDCSGTISKDIIYTSTAHDYTDHSGTLYVYVDEVYKASISHNGHYSLSIGVNQYATDINYYVKVVYADDQEVYDTAEVIQYASVFTYDRPVIIGNCDNVPASGGWAYFVGTATQARYMNGTRVYPDLDVSSEIEWSVAGYHGDNLHTTETTTETKLGDSTATCTANGQSAIPVTTSCYQDANIKTKTGEDTQTIPLEPLVHTERPSVSISADYYYSAGSKCPASGGSTPIRYSGSYYKQTRDRWIEETTEYFEFTSGDHDTEVTTVTEYGQWTELTYTSVDPDIYGGATWTHNSNDVISIDNRGTNNNDTVSGDARSTTYTAEVVADDGTATDSVTLYQQENTKTEIVERIGSIEITTQGAIPSSGGTFNVSYVSQESYGSYIYTSGATSGTPSTRSRTGEISCTNCSYNGSTRFNVSGTGTITLTVPANTSSSSRYASVLLDGYEGDSIEQYELCTFGLLWGTTNIYDGYEFIWSRPRDIPSSINLQDSGSNHRVYSFSKSSGNVANIDYNIMSQTIEVTGITAGMDDWFQVSEASSGQSITFYINTNIL